MKLRCLLIDPEPLALDMLALYVEAVEELAVVARCENTLQALRVLQQQPIDLLFLDIAMPRLSGIEPNLSGTDFLRTLRNPPSVIIITTHREFAFDAYELDVIDYLLKPVPFDRFMRAVGKVIKLMDSIDGDLLVGKGGPNPSKEGFLYVRADHKLVKVMTQDILYIESLKDYIRITTATHKPLVVKQTISGIEAMLPADQFLRVHRSFIAATAYVTTYTPHQLEIAGQALPIGRLYQKEVERALQVKSGGRFALS